MGNQGQGQNIPAALTGKSIMVLEGARTIADRVQEIRAKLYGPIPQGSGEKNLDPIDIEGIICEAGCIIAGTIDALNNILDKL